MIHRHGYGQSRSSACFQVQSEHGKDLYLRLVAISGGSGSGDLIGLLRLRDPEQWKRDLPDYPSHQRTWSCNMRSASPLVEWNSTLHLVSERRLDNLHRDRARRSSEFLNHRVCNFLHQLGVLVACPTCRAKNVNLRHECDPILRDIFSIFRA